MSENAEKEKKKRERERKRNYKLGQKLGKEKWRKEIVRTAEVYIGFRNAE